MDILTYGLLNKKVEEAKNVSGEKITEAVNTYLDENPPTTGATAEQAAQIDKNVADIGELKGDLINLYNAFDFGWKEGYYTLNKGEFYVTPQSYYSSIKLPFNTIPSFITDSECWKSRPTQNFFSFWNGSTYVGYYQNGKYYNPSKTEVESLNFDTIAVSIYYLADYTSISFDSVIDKIYELRNAKNDIDSNKNIIESNKYRIDGIEGININPIWIEGEYWRLTNASIGHSTNYNRTEKVECRYIPTVTFTTTKDRQLFVWNNDSYIGYYDYKTEKWLNGANEEIQIPTIFTHIAINVMDDISTVTSIRVIGKLDDIEKEISEITHGESKLYGKKLVVIGDSIAKGASYEGAYGKIIADEYNMTFVNNARNGATIGNHNDTYSVILDWFTYTVNNIKDLDYFILEGGFNDSWVSDNVFGTLDETYATPSADGTFCGNLNYILYTLVHKFPTKKYGYVIVHKAGSNYTEDSEYYKATVKLCKKWGVPICDLNSIVPPFALLDTSDTLRTTYTGSGDGVHPNEQGYKLYYVPHIIDFMLSL